MGVIRILPPQTARRIAAGEVIDRPASALRELIDNAIDAGADDISVSIMKGGIEEISVADNGTGMSEDDLALSIQEHATSKIYEADDLLRATTLGFRGEALASIAAVARLEIATKQRESEQGWRLLSVPFQPPLVEPFSCREGTRVTMRGLFEAFPARRQFLKRPQSEAQLCRAMFIERALAHPAITFRWQSSGESETLLPETYAQRIARCYPELSRTLLFVTESSTEKLKAIVVYADISWARRDRKFLQVFINRRKVPEWSILSLVDYAFGSYLPGGAHPCAFVFLDIDPSQADFNIHPAKREVRLRNAPQVRDALYSLLMEELKNRYGKNAPLPQTGFSSDSSLIPSEWHEAWRPQAVAEHVPHYEARRSIEEVPRISNPWYK
ncbi:MAG: DNA mismatch repair endonuclease MutL, partial [Rectinema sp.]|nr:DNA mismatch repair endonuclease MutL [Rectinema sp.]